MPLKWLCDSDNIKRKSGGSWKPSQEHMTQLTQWQHGTKTDMRRRKSSRKDHETWGRLSVDRRESAWLRDEEDELWMSGADTHSCWEESRGSFPISRNTWNVWPTDGTLWRNFPCCFPPPKTPLAFTSETAGRVDLRISLRVGHEKASSWEMNWQWIDRTVGATLPI